MQTLNVSINGMSVRKLIQYLILPAALLGCWSVSNGQVSSSFPFSSGLNGIPTSVTFLSIAPDGRSSGMGDAGVASAPDVNSQHWNSAKYAFSEGNGGMAVSYIPWVTNLLPHVSHFYVAGYYKKSDKNVFSSSFRYFSTGAISYSGTGTQPVQFHPQDIALDAGYSRKFTGNFSVGLVLRYIHSNLTAGHTATGSLVPVTGTSIAVDLGLYYQNEIVINGKDAQWAIGMNIANMGPPVSYTDDADGLPIPTNLRMGGRFTCHLNGNNALSFLVDLNKLLVPTPAIYAQDSLSGDLYLVRGKESGSVIGGMLQSFYDAPGWLINNGRYSTAKEEFSEIAYGLGTEYWYKKQFAVRGGYFHENQTKGNRRYFTFGLGFRYRFLTWDISYLLPKEGKASPLYNTFRFSMLAEFGSKPG